MGPKFKLLSVIFLLFLVISCDNETIINNELSNDALEQAYQEVASQKQPPAPAEVIKNNAKKVYVHYMPWFFNLEQDGYWGQHWTMTNKDPNNIDITGKREIASHYYPLIGPYSSNDNDVQEYHLLLMKLSGIDGVIFDWYSSRDANDYKALKSSTESFIKEIEEVGLEFAIMYEDKTSQYTTTQKEDSSITNAVTDLKYIQDTYFTSENYIKINDAELLFIFGPNYITDPLDWEFIIPQLNSTPYFMSLWEASDRLGQYAGGEFSWVDSNHMITLSNYYKYSDLNNIQTVGSIYPGFNDFYYEGGWRPNTDNDWVISNNGTQVLNETLTLTDSSIVEFIQLITWNDFGEGTMIEPTNEFGFLYLEEVQSYTGVPYTFDDLQLPYKLYLLRKKHKNNKRVQTILDRVYQFIFMLDLNKAKNLLSTLEEKYAI